MFCNKTTANTAQGYKDMELSSVTLEDLSFQPNEIQIKLCKFSAQAIKTCQSGTTPHNGMKGGVSPGF